MLGVREKPETRTPPAKAWRNYYRIYTVLYLRPEGPWFPGVHAGPSLFASKDIAETHARGFLAELNPPGRWFADHVGAFPEGDGERAN